MHVLPRVAELERRFPETLVGIGVHSGKYPRERRTEAIRLACERLEVEHPVVNDRQFRIWRGYAVEAWPTVALISPDGYVLGEQAGEFDVEAMAETIERAQREYAAALRIGRLDFGTDKLMPPEPTGALRFPGRVCAAEDGRMFVSDTGHHRVLELWLERDGGTGAGRGGESGVGGGWRARIERVFGDGAEGLVDGVGEEARFAEPQGLAIAGGRVYVADRRNHAIRAIELTTGAVRTIAGTGEVGSWRTVPGAARATPLRSPWGLVAWGETLYVTMAGSHQLWAVDLGRETHELHVIAGTGGENITDGPALEATLAQPTGATLSEDGRLFLADSESSAVREVYGDGHATVRSVVGTGLFEHGDRDGVGDEALLQHPQDLAWHDGGLIVADTYNSKLKRLDPLTRECVALPGDAGSGEALLEPSGICMHRGTAFVADTDHHRIVAVDVATGEVAEVAVE